MKTKTVLSIEDNEDLRVLIRLTLTFKGYTVLQARNAAEGLALLRQQRPDIVLLDVMMPGQSGLSLLETLNADAHLRDTPVIMISALGSQQDVEAGLTRGARAYLVKPFDPSQLLSLVAELMPAAESA